MIILKLTPVLRSKDPDTGEGNHKGADTDDTPPNSTALASVLGIIFISGMAMLTPTSNVMASDHPPVYLLKKLETRLTKAPECLPNCISLNNGSLTVKGNNLELNIEAHTQGHHKLVNTGKLLGDQASVSFPNPIHNFKVVSMGWLVDGLMDDRVLNSSLTLRSTVSIEESKKDTLTLDPISPLVTVQHTFILDKEWHVETTVVRSVPKNGPIAVSIPLIDKEKVLDNDLTIKEGLAHVQLKYNQRAIRWHSVLEPLWRPWPGEKITVNISQPIGVNGPTHTVEKAELKYSPGERIQKSTLSLTIRSSLGEDYSFSIPKDAEILSATNGNKKLNIPSSNTITVPLQPGLQNVTVDFQEKKEMGWNVATPPIHLPSTATNISLTYSLARDRWPLYFNGPAIGPAMLYWGILVVIILSAFVLTIIIKKCRLNVPINIIGWLLLGIGLSTVNSYGVFAVIIFFVLLNYRKDYIDPSKLSSLNFKLLQAGIILITVVAAPSVLSAIPMGLLSTPDMKVVGNGSISHFYRFYRDTAASGNLPIANVITPLFSATNW